MTRDELIEGILNAIRGNLISYIGYAYDKGYEEATAVEYENAWKKGYDKGKAEAFQVFQDALREIRILETDCSWKGDRE